VEDVSKKKSKEKERKGKSSRRRKGINIDSWIDKYIMDFISITGLDILGLDKEAYKELLSDIMIELYGSLTSYTNVKTLAKRYLRNRRLLDEVIASRLAAMLDKFTEDQLEFIVYNVGDSVLNLAPKIYEEIKKLGRDDLAAILRVKWANAWLKVKKTSLPLECPNCGFNAVMPDLTCLVCNSVLKESEIKQHINFMPSLKTYTEALQCDDLKKLLNYDYVLMNGAGIKLPWERREPIDVEIFLSDVEKKLLKEEYKVRCEQKNNADHQ
jgi:hypothetical protein